MESGCDVSLETQSQFWTDQYLGLPPRPQGAVDLIRELRDKHWTTDDWRMFLVLLGEDPDQETLLQEHWNDGYEVGKLDGHRDGRDEGEDDGYADGHAEGVKEGIRQAKEEFAKAETKRLERKP